MERMEAVMKYPAMVRPLSRDDGGGYLIEIPDLPGCIADGDSLEEALRNAEGAVQEWMAAASAEGRAIPKPGSADLYSGKWVQRVPKTLHMRLASQARREGVSLNAFATALLAEGLGKKEVAP